MWAKGDVFPALLSHSYGLISGKAMVREGSRVPSAGLAAMSL